jgi:hypothetical protein
MAEVSEIRSPQRGKSEGEVGGMVLVVGKGSDTSTEIVRDYTWARPTMRTHLKEKRRLREWPG